MPRGPQFTPQERARICELHETAQWGASRIHRMYPGWKLSSIRSTIRRYKGQLNTTDFTTTRPSRSRALDEEDRDRVYDIVSYEDPHIKMRDLLDSVDNKVKKRSLQRLLREMDLRKWVQKKRPRLTADRAQARLNWAINHQHYTLNQWKKVLWSDECIVERSRGIKPTWTFTRPREQLERHDVQQVLCSGKGVKKMFWACFRDNIRSGLVPLDSDPMAARGGVSA